MWLYGALQGICWAATRSYYRFTIGGGRVPADGPVLLVSNHQNSLVDPAMVVVAAERPVRFLAKSTLFTDPRLGWLVQGVGSIPVYRQQDDPTRMGENRSSFRAVHAALADGAAVGIFPEGISHRNPSLTPLKSGAARVALGAASTLGRAFPIVPVGLVFRDQPAFRSQARVVIGAPFAWDDLATRGERDREAVRELTRRIAEAMREVTLNLDSWEDEALVRFVEAVWTAEFGAAAEPAAELARLQATMRALRRLREGEDDSWRQLARDLRGHERKLARFRLDPHTLRLDPSLGEAGGWLLRRVPALLALPVELLAWPVYTPPALVMEWAARQSGEGADTLPTYRILSAAFVGVVWCALLALAAGLLFDWKAGSLALFTAPLLAWSGIALGQWREGAWQAIRRFFVRRLQRPRVEELRTQQRTLAQRLVALQARRAQS